MKSLKNLNFEKIQNVDRSKETINFIKNKQCNIFLISHFGRPKENFDEKYSFSKLIDQFEDILELKLNFISYDSFLDSGLDEIDVDKPTISLLENIRFFEGEIKNDLNFSKSITDKLDLYVNEAFSASHRFHSSVNQMAKNILSAPGFNFEREILAIDNIKKSPKKKLAIIGGSKVSTKIKTLLSLTSSCSDIFIGGAMANNFLKFKGFNVGLSLLEKGTEKIINDIYAVAEKNNCNIIIPVDCIVSNNLNGSPKHKSINEITSEDMVLDIGKKTVDLINKTVENSKTVFWNGPAGYFENKNFSNGTIAIAKKIGENTQSKSLISIVGGGDTLAAIKNTDYQKLFTHLSTAGGAFLESLEGKQLPGVKVLTN